MNTNLTYEEHVQRLVLQHSRGIICAGEVWGQVIELVTPETVEAVLRILPDDLQFYLQHKSIDAPLENCKTERQRRGLEALQNWYRTHEST